MKSGGCGFLLSCLKLEQITSSELLSVPTLTAAGVVGPQVKEAVLAAVAPLTLHGVFADTLTGQRIAEATAFGTGRVAVARWETNESE